MAVYSKSAATLFPPYVPLEQALIEVFEVMQPKQLHLRNFEILTSGVFFCVCVFYTADADIDLYARDGTSAEIQRRFTQNLLASRLRFSFLELPEIDFRFDSKENVDKNYLGSYHLFWR
ncbi:hypothetical protein D3C87_1018170 [compost metagenome]